MIGWDCNEVDNGIYNGERIEEIADMYMNWILDKNSDYPYNGFKDTAPGAYSLWTRGGWMDDHMPGLLL